MKELSFLRLASMELAFELDWRRRRQRPVASPMQLRRAAACIDVWLRYGWIRSKSSRCQKSPKSTSSATMTTIGDVRIFRKNIASNGWMDTHIRVSPTATCLLMRSFVCRGGLELLGERKKSFRRGPGSMKLFRPVRGLKLEWGYKSL